MTDIKILTLILFLLSPFYSYSQNVPGFLSGKGLSIIPQVTYVSSASIQLNPFSADLSKKTLTEELSGGYGYGLTIRKKMFRDDITFGISAEYMKINDRELVQLLNNDSSAVRVRVSEELTVIPLEFTGYFNLPDFSENLRIFLGGGVGVYFGDRKRSVLNISSSTISKKIGFSLVVLSGMEYKISDEISGVFEIKFREAEYKVKSEFPVSGIVINNVNYEFDKELYSKIFVDGLKLSFGISYNF
ncbi:MAG: outer membrane beta-barrel protein [Bacteroidetes bacterium]|nr:outer membrane beta-barrel protein [Bacteroidota bacterium]